MAKVLHFPPNPSPETLQEVHSCVQQGGVLSLITESSYALAASVGNPRAIDRIVNMKGDRQDKPILILIGEESQLGPLISTVPPGAKALIDHFWPGPLTLVLPAASQLPAPLTCGTGTIGVRQPREPRLLALLNITGPLTGTSANRSGASPLHHPDDVQRTFGNDLDLIVDAGIASGGMPSTVLSLVGEIRLLRKGPISSEAIREVLSTLGLTLQESAE